MGRVTCEGRAVDLSYSTNVHPAETAGGLLDVLRRHVAPVSRAVWGDVPAAVNLRLGMKQADELLGHPVLPSTSTIPDAVLAAPPTPACAQLSAALSELKLYVASVNGFPIREFHAPRVKEGVYSPPWTDGGRVLYSVKIAKVLANLLGEQAAAPVSVPTGTFKGYGDHDELKEQCAHFLTEAARDLARLERLTGKTVALGLEPEPCTTGETVEEFVDYFENFLLPAARAKFPAQLGLSVARAEDLARRFLTVNLDLCHQAVEFEDSVETLRRLRAAGIALSGLHLSAALKLPEPAAHPQALAQLLALDEPRYLHQVVARRRDGTLLRCADLPDLSRGRGVRTEDLAEVRCHFHVPLCAELPGPLASTRDTVAPAARFAAREGLTTNFVVETYTWGVLSDLARGGSPGAQQLLAKHGADVNAGIVAELRWARKALA
jgi:hypothetical protein